MTGNNIQQKQKVYLRAESILRFFTTDNERLDTLIMCQNTTKIMTTDQSLYEALGSVEDKSKINLNKLVKLLEVTEITSFKQAMNKERTILKDERVKEIIEKANQIK